MKLTIEIPDAGTPLYALRALGEALAAAAGGRPGATNTDGAAPFGYDPFGTPYESEADRERGQNLVAWGEAFAAKAEALEPGQLDCRTFTTEDAMFFWRFGAELTQYVGPRAPENRLVNGLDEGRMPLPEFPHIGAVDQALLRGGWDWSNYRGPLRAILAKHRGVADI